MMLQDYRVVFLPYYKEMKNINYILKVLNEKFNLELPDFYNDENLNNEEYKSYLNKNENELSEMLAITLEALNNTNEEILKSITSLIDYKSKLVNSNYEKFNIEALIDVANEMSFSKEMVIALHFAKMKNNKDKDFLINELMNEYDVEMKDIIYAIYTSPYIISQLSDFSKHYLEDYILNNYLREDIFESITLTISETMGTENNLKEFMNTIPNLWENLEKAKLSKEHIELLKMFFVV